MACDAGAIRAGLRAVAATSLGEIEEDTARVAALADAAANEQLDGGASCLGSVVLVSELRAAVLPAQAGHPSEPVQELVVADTGPGARGCGGEQLADRVAKRMQPALRVQRIRDTTAVLAKRVRECKRIH